MPFKYKSYHEECEECGVSNLGSIPADTVCFRLVKDSAVSDQDFLPPAIEQPQRSFKNAKQRCSGYALSMFTSSNSARQLREKFLKQSNYFQKKKCIAEIALKTSDGKIGQEDQFGHFDLHEYKDTCLTASVTGYETA